MGWARLSHPRPEAIITLLGYAGLVIVIVIVGLGWAERHPLPEARITLLGSLSLGWAGLSCTHGRRRESRYWAGLGWAGLALLSLSLSLGWAGLRGTHGRRCESRHRLITQVRTP